MKPPRSLCSLPTAGGVRPSGLRYLRPLGLALAIGLLPAWPVTAQVNVQLNILGSGFGVELRSFPSMVLVPGYPVYYAPQLRSNYFFYDDMYWVFAEDTWYESRWYNGPWGRVNQDLVPLYLLRVPVRYYRQPPVYFRGWRADAPPRWNEHWGNDWAARRPGWDRWDRREAPRAAPLPVYQRPFAGARYPREPMRQEQIRAEHERPRSNPAPALPPRAGALPMHPMQQAMPQQAPQHAPQAPFPAGPPQHMQRPHPQEAQPSQQQQQQQQQQLPQRQPQHAPLAAPPGHVAPPPQHAPAAQPPQAREGRPAPQGRGGDKRGEKDDNPGGDQRQERGAGRHNGERP
jgi:hypothetical protein